MGPWTRRSSLHGMPKTRAPLRSEKRKLMNVSVSM
jgi:hypothetical protein